MHYDVVIIGAGMSGLAAGIRLAYFEKRVVILEKHYAYGGLNSYYRLDGRDFDVGLHAITNFAPPQRRNAPLNRLLRQLRIPREELDLHPQTYSEIQFPGERLRFSNDVALLRDEVARAFPGEADRFVRLLREIEEYDDARLDGPHVCARGVLRERLHDPMLVEMLLCPVMFYGSAEERDMDWTPFVTLFKSILLEGFARPPEGVRTIIKALVRKFRACGGEIRMSCGVQQLKVRESRVTQIALQSGETITADIVLSSAGYVETANLCAESPPCLENDDEVARVSFVETIGVLDALPAAMGHQATIVFYNTSEEFAYETPIEPVDLRSGIFCCPNNYTGHESLPEGITRLTWLANYDRWASLDDETYAATKRAYQQAFIEQASRFVPALRDHLVYTDMFTPRTIRQYTGHLGGAVYGSPRKRRDGRTALANLFIIGTDQGYLGIVGAMLSGVMMANMHVLAQE
jgi:phytoene dehydrogenase-like protein